MVRIITDSAADFEPQELQQLNITCIPLRIMMDGQEYEENVNLTKPRFFELLASLEGAPKPPRPLPRSSSICSRMPVPREMKPFTLPYPPASAEPTRPLR